MSAGAIIAIVIAAIVLIALLAVVLPRVRERNFERRRAQASDLRDEARQHEVRAQRDSAAAEEQAARARREAAEAQQRAERAAGARETAREHAEKARAVDPDVDDGEDGSGRTDGAGPAPERREPTTH